MPTMYAIRVELVGLPLDHQNYKTLHARMDADSMRRTFTVSKVTYRLPPGEYFLFQDGTTTAAVRDRAAKAAANLSTGGSRVVVTRTTTGAEDLGFEGLEVVTTQ
jgi:hypothetical protein